MSYYKRKTTLVILIIAVALVLVVFACFLLYLFAPHESSEISSIVFQAKDIFTSIWAVLFIIIGYIVLSSFKIEENRDSLVFQKKFEHYQKYINSLIILIEKGHVTQSDLVEIQRQYANIAVLMNSKHLKALEEVMQQTAKILWNIQESQAKRMSQHKIINAPNIDFLKHLTTIARAMQCEIHGIKYKKDKKIHQNDFFIDVFSKDILGAISAQKTAMQFEIANIIPIKPKNIFDCEDICIIRTLSLYQCGEMTYAKCVQSGKYGFYWCPYNKRKGDCYLKWSKQIARILSQQFGGVLFRDYSCFIPCKKKCFSKNRYFNQTKRELFDLIYIMFKQYQAYQEIEFFLNMKKKKRSWKVALWEYDTVFLQTWENEEYGNLFVDITYNMDNDEYRISMGCRIEETEIKPFEQLAEKLEQNGIFDYHRELRRGYYKAAIKQIDDLCENIEKCVNHMERCRLKIKWYKLLRRYRLLNS